MPSQKESNRELRSGSSSSMKSVDSPLATKDAIIISKITALTERINKLEDNLKESFKNQMEDALADVFDKLNNKINAIEMAFTTKLNDCESKISNLHNQLEASSKATDDLKVNVNSLNERLTALETVELPSNIEVEQRIFHLERLSHSCDLIISGIPSQCNNLKRAFDDICKALSTNFDHSHTGAIFRLPSGSVIIKFISLGAKQSMFYKYLKFAKLDISHIGFQGNQRLYINESLCRHTSDLLKMANQMRADGWIAKTYTKNGFLYILKTIRSEPIKIVSRDQLLTTRKQNRLSILNPNEPGNSDT